MFEFIGIFGDVIRIVTFQRSHEPIRNGFAPQDRCQFRETSRTRSVPRVGGSAVGLTTIPNAG